MVETCSQVPGGRRRHNAENRREEPQTTLLPEEKTTVEGVALDTDTTAVTSGPADDTKTRLITAAKYVPTLAYTIFQHTWAWYLFVILITTGAVYEYRIIVGHVWPRLPSEANASQNGNASSFPNASTGQYVLPCRSLTELTLSDYTMFATACLLAATATFGNLVVFHMVATTGIAMLLVSHFLDGSLTGQVEMERMYELSLRVMGSVYVAWPLSHANMIAAIPKYGPGFMFVALYCSWFGDGAAYFIGKKIGKTPLFPAISPKKSTEGFIANIFASCVPLLVLYVLRENGIWIDLLPSQMYLVDYIGLGLLLGVLGPMGDLLESYIKRAANVKDSGDFFPGHGGMLDRFDSFLLALPVYYYFVVMVYV